MKNTLRLITAIVLLMSVFLNAHSQVTPIDSTLIIEEEIQKVETLENDNPEDTSTMTEEERQKRRDEFFGTGSANNDYDDDDDVNFSFNIGKGNNKTGFRVFLLDLGISGYTIGGSLNLPVEYDQFNLKYTGSTNVNLHAFRHRMQLIKPSLFFEYGMSFNFRQYKFQNDFRIEPEVTTLNLIDDGVNYKVNKLRTSYLEIPVLFTIAPQKSEFRLSLGFYGGMKIGSNQKLKSEAFGKEKIKDDFNLRAFTSGFVARAGFGPIEFYMTIQSSSLFVDGIQDDLVPFSAGIALIGF